MFPELVLFDHVSMSEGIPAEVNRSSVEAPAPSKSVSDTVDCVGTEVNVQSTPTAELSSAVASVPPKVIDVVEPTATFADAAETVGSVTATALAYAGTTDKSPNPSEATATADTFFNEIVFTIFLSFSQTKDDLLSGW
jgi:hypothetical protein